MDQVDAHDTQNKIDPHDEINIHDQSDAQPDAPHQSDSMIAPSHSVSIDLPDFRDKIDVFCPLCEQQYPGVVSNIEDDGRPVIACTDGDQETLVLGDEVCRY